MKYSNLIFILLLFIAVNAYSQSEELGANTNLRNSVFRTDNADGTITFESNGPSGHFTLKKEEAEKHIIWLEEHNIEILMLDRNEPESDQVQSKKTND